jgi:hypothetical protein
MKDMLDREIMVGDTLAYSVYHSDLGSELKVAKVIATAAFAVQCDTITRSDNEPSNTFVVSYAKSPNYVICDWAKGSQAAS